MAQSCSASANVYSLWALTRLRSTLLPGIRYGSIPVHHSCCFQPIPNASTVNQPILIDEAINIILRVMTISVSDAPAFKLGGMHTITNNQAPTCSLIHRILFHPYHPLSDH